MEDEVAIHETKTFQLPMGIIEKEDLLGPTATLNDEQRVDVRRYMTIFEAEVL